MSIILEKAHRISLLVHKPSPLIEKAVVQVLFYLDLSSNRKNINERAQFCKNNRVEQFLVWVYNIHHTMTLDVVENAMSAITVAWNLKV